MHIWDRIEDLAQTFIQKLALTGNNYVSENKNGWQNYLFQSARYRRAHVEIVDFRNQHKIYILHTTIFPHFNDPSPIFGFDAVCGPSKITGAFHDFSSGGDANHFMMNWFAEESSYYGWKKNRELPPWAKAIFSPSMIAAGNIQEGKELDNLCKIAHVSLDYYLKNIGATQDWPNDYHMAQNRYCYHQKQNPHVINSMIAMGIPEDEMRKFIDEVLFPETKSSFYV